jgi:hypothetical protein
MVLDLMVKPLYKCEMQNLASRYLTKVQTNLQGVVSGFEGPGTHLLSDP